MGRAWRLHDGKVEQIGPIEEVFRRPANAQVAGIMGIATCSAPG